MRSGQKYWFVLALAAIVAGGMSLPAAAGRPIRGESRASVGGGNRNQNLNVNRNANINQNVNVNRDINVNREVNVVNVNGGGYRGCCYHPVATAVAVTAAAVVTAAVVGSIVHSVPPSCTSVIVNGLVYQQCGSTWYQPQLSGSSTTYIVVNPPR